MSAADKKDCAAKDLGVQAVPQLSPKWGLEYTSLIDALADLSA